MSQSSFKIFFLLLVSILFAANLFGQSRNELEKKKKQLIADIEFKNKLLEETQENKKASLNQLVLLNNKISEREDLIKTISREIVYLEKEKEKTESLIRALEQDLQRYKDEYAKLVYNTFKTKNSYDKLMYILGSQDINQAFRRIKYLQQYAEYRINQAELIVRTQEQLSKKREQLSVIIEDKQSLLEEEKASKNVLFAEKSLQQNVYQDLKNKEKQLRDEIKKNQREAERLKKAIQKIIEEELRRQEEAKKKSGFAITPEAKALSQDFQNNKGKLPWPVEKGVITEKYGEHPHPVLREVKVQNNGLNIGTTEGASARAVFSGTVSGIVVIPGAGIAIIVRHGEFLTVYSNLAEVFVKKGDAVEVKQELGKVITDKEKGKTEIHFELWKGQVTENPAYWLYNAN